MRVELHIIDGHSTTVDLPELPAEDERVVIEGKDYRVYSRTWYIDIPTTEVEVRLTLVEL